MAALVSSALQYTRQLGVHGHARSRVNRGEHYSFVIYARTNGFFLGGVGINFINYVHNFANVGYWVRTHATRHGVATAAVRLAAEFAFTELKLTRLEIVTGLNNQASQRVAEKLGAVREGVLRRRMLLYGEAHDATLFSLIPEDVHLKPAPSRDGVVEEGRIL